MAPGMSVPPAVAAVATHADELKRLWALFNSADPSAMEQILSSPLTSGLIKRIQEGASQDKGGVFCTCPNCGTSFETDLG